MRTKPPCRWAFEHDCPYRRQWCHHTCEQFAEWKTGIQAENEARERVHEAEYPNPWLRKWFIKRLKEGRK